jgi:dihydropteroate synthase
MAGRHRLSFDRTLIMGVLNVTLDSFSDGGRFSDNDAAVRHAQAMVAEGADIIDIGGESSRPGANEVPAQEELERVLPLIQSLAPRIDAPVSIDTYKAKVASECLGAGASIVNDITGLKDKRMIEVCAQRKAPAIVMHMRGKPQSMQDDPQYIDVVAEIIEFLQSRIDAARAMGVNDIIVDPGIGFGKTLEHNLEILRRLREFEVLDCPILIGPSRKSFIGKVSGLEVNERLEGTLAAVSIAIMNGANIVRVHDVMQCKRAAQVADAIRGA